MREEAGLSRRDLARLTGPHGDGVKWETIRDLESGQTRKPHESTISMLADALTLSGGKRAEFIAAARAMAPRRPAAGSDERSARGSDTGSDTGSAGGSDSPDRPDAGPAAGPPLPQAVTPRTLPYDIETFTGRLEELRKLTDGARRVEQTGRTVVYVIEAMGGLGKTTLAVHAAHLIIAQFPGLFPDAHLFLNLRGYTQVMSAPAATGALTANEALRALLRQLNVPHERIPPKQVQREELFRSTLAGKRALLILDNAKDAAQVRPLLPGSAACLVIVTTRDALHSLDGTTVLHLGAPSQAEAIEHFTAVAGMERTGPGTGEAGLALVAPADVTRLAGRDGRDDEDDRDDLAKIVGLCRYLPLAVQIAAARLRHRDAYTVATILAELQAEDDLLSNMQDRQRGVRAAFQSSVRYLDPAERELFIRLALVPGADFDACAVASLSGRRIGAARDHLESLLDRNLLVQSSPGRYEFHDLVRRYAQELARRDLSEATRAQAIDRLLNFYLFTAQAAGRLFESGLPRADDPAGGAVRPAAMPGLRTAQDAKAWMSTELPNLKAAAELAADKGRPRIAIGLSVALSDYLRAHGPWPWALSLHQTALALAMSEGNKASQAAALRSIGGVLSRTGEIARSKETLGKALEAYRELNDRRGIARTLIELGIAQRVDGETARSRDSLSEALDICRRIGEDTLGEAAALNELASVYYQTGPLSEAERHLASALRIYRKLRNRQGQAAALLYLGPIQQLLGSLDAADESLREARQIGDQLGQPILVANSLLYLGDVQREKGELEDAKASLEQAHDLYRRLRYRQGIALSLSYLGRALFRMGMPAEASARLTEAIAHFDELSDWGNKAEAVNTRAALARAAGRRGEARDDHAEALRLAVQADSELEQGAAHLGLAALDADEGKRPDAITHCQEALGHYEAAGYKAGAAAAREMLVNLGAASAA